MDAAEIKRLMWQEAARERGLIPQPHGGALMPGGGYRPGAGRPKSRVKMALERAKGDPLRQLEIARQCWADDSLPFSERLRAMYFTMRLARLDREEPRRSARSTFVVVRRSPAEMIGRAQEAERDAPVQKVPYRKGSSSRG